MLDSTSTGGTTAAADGLAAGMGAMKLSSAAADLPPRQAARPSAAPAVPSYWLPRRDNAPSVISSRTTHSSCEEDDAVLLSASIEEDPAVRQPPARPAPAAASAFNHDSNSATASLAARLRAITMNNPIAAMQQQQQQQASAVPPAVRSHTPTDFRPAAYGHELDTQHGYGGDQDFGRQPAAGSKAAAVPKIKGWSQGAFAMHRVESPSAAAGDDEYEYDDDTYDEQYDDQYEETALAPGATTRSGASMRYHGQYGSPAAAHCDQYGSHRLPRPASAGSTATGYSTGPRAGSAATTLRRGPGASPAGGLPKKTDRVARYQQMAGQWNKDKFLATGEQENRRRGMYSCGLSDSSALTSSSCFAATPDPQLAAMHRTSISFVRSLCVALSVCVACGCIRACRRPCLPAK